MILCSNFFHVKMLVLDKFRKSKRLSGVTVHTVHCTYTCSTITKCVHATKRICIHVNACACALIHKHTCIIVCVLLIIVATNITSSIASRLPPRWLQPRQLPTHTLPRSSPTLGSASPISRAHGAQWHSTTSTSATRHARVESKYCQSRSVDCFVG